MQPCNSKLSQNRRLPCQAGLVPGLNHDYLLHSAPTLAPEDSSSRCQTKAVLLRQLLTLPPGLRLPKIKSIMSDEILLNIFFNNRKIKPSSWRTFRELTESFREVACRYILIKASKTHQVFRLRKNLILSREPQWVGTTRHNRFDDT